MLTLITGTPGAGKSLYAVSTIARKVPGSKVPDGQGGEVLRVLHSNIKNLIVPHEHMTGDDLNVWHTWAKPGDVILFDEVQEVWRPRGKVSEVPACIAKLETHRHMGVDIVLVTQNPMLVDSNIRRLVNQHIHLRRLSKGSAFVYEWDSCQDAPTSAYSRAMTSKFWMHPKDAYSLYKSAELHTKPTVRVPKLLFVGVAAVAAAAYAGPTFYARLQERLNPAARVSKPAPAAPATWPVPAGAVTQGSSAAPVAAPTSSPVAAPPAHLGCIAMGDRCSCFGEDGRQVDVEPHVCREGSQKVGYVLPGYGVQPHADVWRGNRQTNGNAVGTPSTPPAPAITPAPSPNVGRAPGQKPDASTS